MKEKYDAFLLVSFGGPEGMDDVLPFLENVLRGKNVPRERMLRVAQHYQIFQGVSPINEQNRQLIRAIQDSFAQRNITLPVYWGNRNWHPLLADTLQKMAEDGVKRAMAFVTSAYSSYSGCRQYLEDIENARVVVGESAPRVDKIRPFFNHPGFIKANVEHAGHVLSQTVAGKDTPVLFTAHSIPLSMAGNCQYAQQLQEVARLVAGQLGLQKWQLVYQSRSGPAAQAWLEPDICEQIKFLHQSGIDEVVVVPIGFISDHMEVKYDLDMEAKSLADELGMKLWRASTAGLHPSFLAMIGDLVEERLTEQVERPYAGEFLPLPDTCPPECCRLPAFKG